jgi:hypothetical protein
MVGTELYVYVLYVIGALTNVMWNCGMEWVQIYFILTSCRCNNLQHYIIKMCLEDETANTQ